MTNRASAQGIDRESISGENVAEQMRQSGVDLPYNLRLGPITIRADADVTASVNDNINLVKTGKIADITLTPTINLHSRWQVSDVNTLQLNVGVGYQIYAFHSQYNDIVLSPDSEASFNFFVGNVDFNVHDSFSYEQDPTQIGQLSNTVRLIRFQNDVGISATWDLNYLVLELSYDHANLWVSESIYDYLTNQTDTVAPRITYHIDSSIDTGLSLSLTDTRYQQSFQNDNVNLTIGPFVSYTVSDHLSLQAAGGGFFTDYSSGGGNGDSENISSFYGNASVNHRINSVMTESASVGREFLPGLTSNFTERIYANYTFTWQATQTIDVGSNLLWENLTDSDGTFREDSDRYGFGFTLDDNLNDRTRFNVNYQFLMKQADPSFLSYTQNQLTFGLSYQF